MRLTEDNSTSSLRAHRRPFLWGRVQGPGGLLHSHVLPLPQSPLLWGSTLVSGAHNGHFWTVVFPNPQIPLTPQGSLPPYTGPPWTALQSPFLNAGSLLDLPVTLTLSRCVDRSHQVQTTTDCVELHGAHSSLEFHKDTPSSCPSLAASLHFSSWFLLVSLTS